MVEVAVALAGSGSGSRGVEVEGGARGVDGRGVEWGQGSGAGGG